MKRIIYLLMPFLLLACQPKEKPAKVPKTENKIKVGVFNRNGDSPWCILDAVEACKIDPNIHVEVVNAAQIASGQLDHFDVFLFPGGGGTSETNSLGHKGLEKIKQLVTEKGKGVVGICAGAYILTDTPDYACFRLSGAKAIDIEHDHRGNALAKFTLTEAGKKMFPEVAHIDTLFCQYYEGPVLVEAKGNYKYSSLATMESDVHVIKGTPANMTNNRPFVVATENGKGRSASFVGHPECTPGMRWMIPRMVRWVSKQKLVAYSDKVVRPQIFKGEVVFTAAQKKKMFAAYDKLKKSPKEVLEGIEEIKNMGAWSAKKWINGLVRHSDEAVRIKAAEALAWMGRTDAITDIEAAISMEKSATAKEKMGKSLQQLKEMIGAVK
ncbi:biofilm PGA synthesis protein PgaB [Prolixibacteraceae bacterium JC049]|nr:biofilm PGA synthesis protein PgaB [Prolixibacteraceae bacterium JC049]